MNKIIPKVQHFFRRNGSTILTCVGAVGVIATAVIAVRETPKAMKTIEDAEQKKGEKLTKSEVIKVAGPAYIPSVLIGASTIACIFGANVLNKKQQASLVSAYALVNHSYKEYRQKANELCGEDTDKRIMRAITELHYRDSDAMKKEDDKQLFFDFFSLQHFYSTVDEVMDAEKRLNELFQSRGYASLGEFYAMLGIPVADSDHAIGWSTSVGHYLYGYNKIEFTYEPLILEGGTDCCVITPTFDPTADYLL